MDLAVFPDDRHKLENLGGYAGRVMCAILRISGHHTSVVKLGSDAIIAPKRGQGGHHALLPHERETHQVRTVTTKVLSIRFIRDGFVKIDAAFPRVLADQGRSILWRDTGCDEGDRTTWARPVIRLGMYGQEPFARAANTPLLHKAFDQLVGPRRWLPRMDLGTFPIRFPSPDDPGDTGWHVDASFPPETGDTTDFLNWHVNGRSKG